MRLEIKVFNETLNLFLSILEGNKHENWVARLSHLNPRNFYLSNLENKILKILCEDHAVQGCKRTYHNANNLNNSTKHRQGY